MTLCRPHTPRTFYLDSASKSTSIRLTSQSEMMICWVIWTKSMICSDFTPPKQQRAPLCFSPQWGPLCTAEKLQPFTRSKKQKRRRLKVFLSSVDSLDITNRRVMVKERREAARAEVKETEAVRASEPRAGNAERHVGVYPRCSDWCLDRKTLCSTMAADKPAVWPLSVLTALTAFKEQQLFFSLFLRWVRSVSAASFTSSPLPLRFPLIPAAVDVGITAPPHVHRPERASCCLLYRQH